MQFIVYMDRAGQYRWRLVARNGQIIADSAESFTRARDAKRSALRAIAGIQRNSVSVIAR